MIYCSLKFNLREDILFVIVSAKKSRFFISFEERVERIRVERNNVFQISIANFVSLAEIIVFVQYQYT